MFYEPGFVPKLGGLTQQKAVIDELLELWKFDEQNFCVPCMVRMPLRSKHCKRCNRCVAKHDQSVSRFASLRKLLTTFTAIAHGSIIALG